MKSFSVKDPREIRLLALNFTKSLGVGETISSAQWVVERVDAVEVTTGMLQGSPDLSEAKVVKQLIKEGLHNGTYRHTAIAVISPAGKTLVLSGLQKVKTGGA